jgi:hypothetical protein
MVSDMNNLYVVSKDGPIQQADEVGPIEDRYDLKRIGDSLPWGLDDLDGKKRREQRYHQRFQIKGDAFASIRSISAGPLEIDGKSMGCIACAVFDAKPVKLGKIDNISMGGLMFQHVVGKTQLSKTFVLDILLAECGFYLADLPFKILSDFVLPDDIPATAFEMRQVRLQFQNLNAIQQARLKDFIFNHGAQNGEIGVNE